MLEVQLRRRSEDREGKGMKRLLASKKLSILSLIVVLTAGSGSLANSDPKAPTCQSGELIGGVTRNRDLSDGENVDIISRALAFFGGITKIAYSDGKVTRLIFKLLTDDTCKILLFNKDKANFARVVYKDPYECNRLKIKLETASESKPVHICYDEKDNIIELFPTEKQIYSDTKSPHSISRKIQTGVG